MPRINAGPQTLRSMRAKGLIDGDRRVTVQALDAALCMDFMERS